ncbi:GGDEF domain-containing protein [Christensenellaceae bacterium OttesenSCG-928-K19]|nr:GGDEF domain-containing protein [Christensenellaceae bacterium OttesenSCG-928-K19]
MDYEKFNYQINRFCEFKSAETENRFLSREGRSGVKMIRVMILMVGIFFFAFLMADHFYYKNTQDVFLYSLLIRMVVLFTCVVMFFAMDRIKNYRTVMGLLSFTELLIFFAYMLICFVQQSQIFLQQAMGVILLILVAFLIPNRWKNSLMNGCLMLVVFLLLAPLYADKPNAAGMVEVSSYVGLFLVGMAVLIYLKERSKRVQYANEKKLEIMTFTDSLTKIYNRLKFETVLETQLETVQETKNPFSVLLFDLDNFKRVNDEYGHAVGDRVLQEAARVIKSNIREGDVFARWGGEEFVVLFENTMLEKGVELAERLRRAVESHYFERAGRVTISSGITQYADGDTDSAIIKRADDLMYLAKAEGKNIVMSKSPEKKEAPDPGLEPVGLQPW